MLIIKGLKVGCARLFATLHRITVRSIVAVIGALILLFVAEMLIRTLTEGADELIPEITTVTI